MSWGWRRARSAGSESLLLTLWAQSWWWLQRPTGEGGQCHLWEVGRSPWHLPHRCEHRSGPNQPPSWADALGEFVFDLIFLKCQL